MSNSFPTKILPLFFCSVCLKFEKNYVLLLIVVFVQNLSSQNLHTHSNAVSIDNEVNNTLGWGGSATLSVSSSNSVDGSYSISGVSTAATGQGKDIYYDFTAEVGKTYVVKIWAKRGVQNADAAFANWTGLSGFSVTHITSTNWTEFTWTVTATSTTPRIKVYAAPWSEGSIGDEILIDSVSILPEDSQNPTIPSNLSSSGLTSSTVTINWDPSSDNNSVSDYEVFNDGASIGMSGGVTSFLITGLSPLTTYNLSVEAIDNSGNRSGQSPAVAITTLASSDNQSPTIPNNLTTSDVGANSIILLWSNSSDNVAVTAYEVFQDGTKIGETTGTTTYNVTGLTANTTYSFTVRAKDAAANVSAFSSALSVTTISSTGGNSGGNTGATYWTKTGDDLSYDHAVGIGTTSIPSNYKLAVNGKIISTELKVELQTAWPDYVFNQNYNLWPLSQVKKHIEEKGHLPNMPSATKVAEEGISLGEMNAKLLRKIEELTLYLLKHQNLIDDLQQQNDRLRQQNDQFQNRILKLEEK